MCIFRKIIYTVYLKAETIHYYNYDNDGQKQKMLWAEIF